jgi:alpha-glucosidase
MLVTEMDGHSRRDRWGALARFLVIGAGLILGLGSEATASQALSVASPDGNLTVSFGLKALPQPYLPGERAYYRVRYKGVPILTDSPLGLDFLGARPLNQDFQIVGTNTQSHHSTWENAFGAKRTVPDNYKEMTVSLQERQSPGRRVDVIFRAYNEGMALRYFLPKQESMAKFALASENTGFYFDRDVSAYALNMGRMNTQNEGEYERIPLNEIRPSSIINLPMLVEIPGGPWVGLLEADLTDYAGMYVSGVPGFNHALLSKLSVPPPNEQVARSLTASQRNLLEQPVLGQTPKATPWRVLMVGPTPGSLIETNYLILNLNPPCALKDTSWIRPGKTSLFWWVGHYPYPVSFQAGENMETLKHYIDFSSQHHFEYALFDDGWSTQEDILHAIAGISIPDLVSYGREKGVKILLWMPWKAVGKQMDDAFPLYEKWGVAGVKVDFMNRDDQEMVSFYDRVIKKASQHHLTVDFHGAYKPTGLRRTYPNLLTREAVMGIEYSLWSNRVTPEHDVTIPFTRMLAGPLDYAPGAFRNAARQSFHPREDEAVSQGTRAHQLALYVAFESPLAMVWGYPEAYENQPGMEFLEVVPTTWDESRVLEGEVGKYIALARQKDKAWYLGAMTNWDAREIEIPLTFLGAGEYDAQIFADGPKANGDATQLEVSTRRVNATSKLMMRMAPGGGFAAIFIPVARN